MLNWLFGGKKDEDKENQIHYVDINTLYQHVSNTLSTIDGITSNLESDYSEEALRMISRKFEEISIEYQNYILVEVNSFYEIIHRSASRLNAARKVTQEAKNVAQLFERYAKNPRSYSAVHSRYKINNLSGALKNLRTYCSVPV